MTPAELAAHQALMRRFCETPLGAAFYAFDAAVGRAWVADTSSGYGGASDRSADAAWKKEREAREALIKLLLPLAGVDRVLCTYGPPAERKRRWLLRFDDPDRGECSFHDEQKTVEFFRRAADQWTCTLFATTDMPVTREGPPKPPPKENA